MISCWIRLINGGDRRAIPVLDDFAALLDIILRNFVSNGLITLLAI